MHSQEVKEEHEEKGKCALKVVLCSVVVAALFLSHLSLYRSIHPSIYMYIYIHIYILYLQSTAHEKEGQNYKRRQSLEYLN